MAGDVNAGKSSLGNLLLGKQSSEVFTEDVNRATSEAGIADFGHWVLIDMPGIGSVLSANDDKIVIDYIHRADVLLIVQHIGSAMNNELYHFLQLVAKGPQRAWSAYCFRFQQNRHEGAGLTRKNPGPASKSLARW